MNIYERDVPSFPDYESCEVIPYKEGFNPKLDKNIEKAYSQDSLWWKKDKENSSSTLNLYMSCPENDNIDPMKLFQMQKLKNHYQHYKHLKIQRKVRLFMLLGQKCRA